MRPRKLLGRLLRALTRRRVPAGAPPRRDGPAGGASVREPRRPKPHDPRGAGAKALPIPDETVPLPDARH